MRIVIVGGVAGGASAAARTRRMDERAEIVLLERDADVSFANCGMPYYLGGEITDRAKLVVASADLLRRRFRIDVRTGHEARRIDRDARRLRVHDHDAGRDYELPYDKLILSPGASPFVPPIPGRDATGVFTLRNLADMDRIAAALAEREGRAVVVGAGFIGLEMAEQLVERGWQVALAELVPQVLPPLDPEMALPLADALRAHGVALHLGDGIAAIRTDAAGGASAVELASGAVLPAELVILGLGVRPELALAREAGLAIGAGGGIATNRALQTSDPDVYAVGDAAEVPYGPTGAGQRVALAGPANRAGRLAGEHAATGAGAPMADVQGTAIVRVFEQGAAITGLSARAAARLGRPVRSVTIVANHHAGYYPGAEPLTLKLSFDPGDGRVLGAQAVGRAGVDKRIDVIATALAFGATVRDLAGLDLAYAPPFGSAKDPVHLAAFAACNHLDGVAEIAEADEDLTDVQVVDVRSPAEIERAPLAGVPHAHRIPVDALRDRLGELDPARPTVVSCAVGLRGHVATRILRQAGFASVRNLSGGATVRERAWRAARGAEPPAG